MVYELNLRDYIRIITKRKVVIIFSGIIFALVAYIYSKLELPVYEAVATVKVMERRTIGGMSNEMDYYPGDMMETQVNVVKGSSIIERAALELGEIALKERSDKIEQVVLRLRQQLQVTRIGYTNLIKIAARGENALFAMRLANAMADSYREENRQEKNYQARKTREFIESQLNVAQARMIEAEDKLKALTEQVKNIAIAEEVQKKLNDLEFQLSALLQKYTDKHPKVMQIRQQIKDLNNQLKDFSAKEVEYDQIKSEVEVNRSVYSSLRQKLEEARISEAEKVSAVSVVDYALKPMHPVNTKSPLNMLLGVFLGLVIGVMLSFFVETLDTSMGTIEDVEAATKVPVLGVVPSVPINDHLKRPNFFQQLRTQFWPQEMTLEQRRRAALFAHHNPLSPVTEAFRHIKTNLQLSAAAKTILVTSAGPKEGKTTVITNLALVCAQEGLKTLIISSDLRKPYVASYFGLEEKPGLSDVVMGSIDLEAALKSFTDMVVGSISVEDAVKHPGLAHLAVLPAGSSVTNPAEILSSGEFNNLLESLKDVYDVVLLDSPPVLPVADASIMAKKVDGIVLCYEIGRTSRHALLRMKAQLDAIGGKILGIILNNISPRTETIEVYPYYRKYTKEYRSQEPLKSEGRNKKT